VLIPSTLRLASLVAKLVEEVENSIRLEVECGGSLFHQSAEVLVDDIASQPVVVDEIEEEDLCLIAFVSTLVQDLWEQRDRWKSFTC